MTKIEKDAQRAEAIKLLKELVKPDSRVYCTLKRVSSSGMSRVIDLLIAAPAYDKVYPFKPEGEAKYAGERDYTAKPKRKLRGYEIRSIGRLAVRAGVGERWDNDLGGVRVGGCGMDMGFALVYDLGRTLYPKGVKKGYSGSPESDGGYALKHEWL